MYPQLDVQQGGNTINQSLVSRGHVDHSIDVFIWQPQKFLFHTWRYLPSCMSTYTLYFARFLSIITESQRQITIALLHKDKITVYPKDKGTIEYLLLHLQYQKRKIFYRHKHHERERTICHYHALEQLKIQYTCSHS